MQESPEIIALTPEEAETVKAYQSVLDNIKTALGELRMQYLVSEQRVMRQLEKSHQDLMTHLRMLSQGKGVPESGDWVFDQSACVFRKRV